MPPRSRSTRQPTTRLASIGALVLAIGLLGAALYDGGVLLASPPYVALQAVFRNVMYSLVSGERSVQSFSHAFGAYFVSVILAVVAIGIAFHRRMMRAAPPGTYIGRAVKGFGLLALATYLLNWQLQGGLGIPFALVYAGLLLTLWWTLLRIDSTRPLVTGAVWAGVGFLISSGIVIALSQSDVRYDFQRLHGVYGFLWMSAVGAYLIEHIIYYEAKRETSSRNAGYIAATLLSAVTLTGLARLHGGGTTRASGLWPHVVTGVVACAAVAIHIGQSWRKRGLTVSLGTGRGSGAFVLACLGLGLILPVLPLTVGSEGRVAADADRDAALLAAPDVGITASGPNHAALPLHLLSIQGSAVSCGKNGGCHVDIQAQWERSAHRFSANAAYRRTVRLMIEDVGIEGARRCAACHDPVPLLTGQIVAGAKYPDEASEGVTCVVCHSMKPGLEAKNGHYTVEPSAVFTGGVKDAFTAYMMIELYRDEHNADFLGKTLTDNSMCASCHNLTQGHLVLRRTFDEWSEGPRGPGRQDTQLCTDCHMPPAGRSYLGFDLHDHRTPAANVALAALRGESPELERAFIAAALDLQIAITRQTSGAFQVTARLANEDGGHTFPTAPRDLVDYWFEVQFDRPNGESEWQRLSPDGLFPERLISAAGDVLTRHEIWRAVQKEGPEGIPARAAHEYVFPLPLPAAGTRQVTLRLMHRRYQDPFLGFLESDTGGLYTQALEVLRRTIPWNLVAPADAQHPDHSSASS